MNFFGNITQRRNRRVSETKSEDFNLTNSELDGTTSNSLPNLSDAEDSEEILQLKKQIKELTLQLETAHREVESLNIDNTNLKKTIEDLTKKENIYKKLTTDIVNNTPKKKKNSQTVPTTIDLSITPKLTKKVMRLAPEVSSKSTPEVIPQLVNKATQCDTHGIEPSICDDLGQMTNVIRPMPMTHKTKKSKLSIISANNRNGLINIIEDSFTAGYEFCHYSYPNGSIQHLLFGIENKVKHYNKTDYCVILIGEKDFLTTKNYHDLIYYIRDTIERLSHTNVIICLPTYRQCGDYTAIYNSRVEMFNNLLYLHNMTYEYAYLLDSNVDLCYDNTMFSGRQGLLNDTGMRNIILNLKKTIYDIEMENSSNTNSMNTNEDISNIFFL